jgi:heterodisulfide reductase subunit B
VLFITQAIGMAIGIDRKKLGLHRHIVNTDMLFKSDKVTIKQEEKIGVEV